MTNSLLSRVLLCIGLYLASPAGAAPLPEAGEPAQIEDDFRRAAALSRSHRSGDIYTLPRPYHFVIEAKHAERETSTVERGGRWVHLEHRGSSHGTPWLYDTRIPLIFYGPGRVREGARPSLAAAQQDVPATLAWLLGVPPPRDCRGVVLREPFLRPTPPRAILTLVIDQGGRNLYNAHPGAYPNIRRLQVQGTDYVNARVAHLGAETALGHIALSTGAYPDRTGIPANRFYHGARGATLSAFEADTARSPLLLESPTLADQWLRATSNRAVVISQSYSDRAALGSAGHGSLYGSNKRPLGVVYDDRTGRLIAPSTHFALPPYLSGLQSGPYAEALLRGSPGRLWFGHKVGDPDRVRATPAFAVMDGDAFVEIIENEPIGQDDITDLLYLTIKSTDAAGHRYGYESAESRAVFTEADRQVGRIVAALARKVGRGNYLVVLTADHGGTPLPELSGGRRLTEVDLLQDLNERFSRGPGSPQPVLHANSTQIWTDPMALAAAGFSEGDLVRYLRDYQVEGRPFYQLVLPASAIEAQRGLEAQAAAARRQSAPPQPRAPRLLGWR